MATHFFHVSSVLRLFEMSSTRECTSPAVLVVIGLALLMLVPSTAKKPQISLELLVSLSGHLRYLRSFLRANPAKPIRPVPSNDNVPGSGTGVGVPLDANPVCGPHPPPDAVQK